MQQRAELLLERGDDARMRVEVDSARPPDDERVAAIVAYQVPLVARDDLLGIDDWGGVGRLESSL